MGASERAAAVWHPDETPEQLHDAALAAFSQWLDDSMRGRTPEEVDLHRTMKVGEECGEAIAALIGVTGANPRKGRTHTTVELVGELLDVAVTALGAVEHFTGNRGAARSMLDDKILTVAHRAGLIGK
jgi:hypothetical protein